MYPYVSIVQVLCIQREKTKRVGGGGREGGWSRRGRIRRCSSRVSIRVLVKKERVIVVI